MTSELPQKSRRRRRSPNDIRYLSDPVREGLAVTQNERVFQRAISSDLPVSVDREGEEEEQPTPNRKKQAQEFAAAQISSMPLEGLRKLKQRIENADSEQKEQRTPSSSSSPDVILTDDTGLTPKRSSRTVFQAELATLRQELEKEKRDKEEMKEMMSQQLQEMHEKMKRFEKGNGEEYEETEEDFEDDEKDEEEEDRGFKPKRTQSFKEADYSDEEMRERKQQRKRAPSLPSSSDDEGKRVDMKKRKKELKSVNQEILHFVHQMADDFFQRGIDVVRKHQLFRELTYENLCETILSALGRDRDGWRDDKMMSVNSRKWTALVQEHIMKYEETVRLSLSLLTF